MNPALRAAVVAAALGLPGALAQESVRTVAGRPMQPGAVDGIGPAGRFSDPAGLAVDAAGTLYVADSANHCVRRLGADGRVTTLLGKAGEAGSADGPAASARLDSPSAVAIGPDGALYVSDTGNHTVRKFQRGMLTTLAGVAGEAGPTNGVARVARFNTPLGLAVDSTGEVFVADSANHSIRAVTPDGTVRTLAGANEQWGAADGAGEAARFYGPVGVTLAPGGGLVVSDSLNHALRHVTPAGVVTTRAGRLGVEGCVDGPAETALFCLPAEARFDARGNLYVVDAFPHLVRKVDPQGRVSTVAGRRGEDGAADGVNGVGRFFNPYGLAIRPNGAVVVADTYNATVREVLPPFRQWIRREPGQATLECETIVGIQYQVWQQPSLGAPWQPASAARAATDLLSAWRLDGPSSDAGTTWFRVQRAE